MSVRCKVCNTSRITNKKHTKADEKWECQTCGNLLNANGYVETIQKQ